MESRIKNKTRNNLIDHRETGQEEMKKQLTELGMYEEGMSLTEMKDILTVVDNSKLSVEQDSMEFSSQPILDKVVTSPQLPLSSIDNYVNKQLKDEDLNSESPIGDEPNKLHQLSSKTGSNIDLHQSKIDKKMSSSCRSADLFNNSELKLSDSTDSQELKSSENDCNVEDNHRLNLSNSQKLDNDISLKLKCLPSTRKKLSMIGDNSHTFNATLDQRCETLNEMAMMWHNYNTKLESCEIQWGLPIKVETANGSLDKKPYSPPDDDQDVLEVDNVEKTPMLTGLRPRLAPKNYTDYILDDDDNDKKNNNDDYNNDDDIEPIFQKRKKISTSIQKPPIRKRSNVKTKKRQSQEAGREEESHSAAKNSMNSKILPINPRKRAAKSPSPEYPEPYNSKKIIIPSRTSNLLNSTETKLNDCQSNKQSTLSMDEQKEKINKTSKNLNADEIESMITDDEDEEIVPNSQEPEKCTDRLNRSSKLLQKSKFDEDQDRHDSEQWQKFVIQSKKLEKENRLRSRLKEQAATASKQEEEEKKEQEQQNKYRNVTTRRSNKWLTTRNELDADQSQSKQPIVVNSDDESSIMGKEEISSDDDTATGYQDVQCPLCNKYFTPNKIESHADQCASMSDNIQKRGSQSEENSEVGRVSPPLLTCQNCKHFRTKDNKAFETHCSYNCDQHFNDQGSLIDKKPTTSMTVQPTLSTSDQSSRKRKR